MLAEVVTAAEFLATVGALKWLVVSVERTVMTFEVLLSAEATGAESAHERLGRVLGQRLLAATTGGSRAGSWGWLLAVGRGAGVGMLRTTRNRVLRLTGGTLGGDKVRLSSLGRAPTVGAALWAHVGCHRWLGKGKVRVAGGEAKVFVAEAFLGKAERGVLNSGNKTRVNALALIGGRVKIVLDVEFEEWLKSREAVHAHEIGSSDGRLNRSGRCVITLEDLVFLVVTGTQRGQAWERVAWDGQVAWVTNAAIRNDGAWDG